ncbi:oxidoreductase [Martensiomyces pterosporus]|nr:oxidoreductase [Martensiomyces pterosporus]
MASALRVFIVDAFTSKAFSGNPAGVVVIPYNQELSEDKMQSIASELNLPMTAFIKPQGEGVQDKYTLLWFNPVEKATFCGHATLASGHVLLNILKTPVNSIALHSPAGVLGVSGSDDGRLTLKFPSNPPEQIEPTDEHFVILHSFISKEFAASKNVSFYFSQTVNDVVVLVDGLSEEQLESLEFTPSPELEAANKVLGLRAVAFTTPGQGEKDSFTRVFNIGAIVREDQVTGSAHTIIAPLFNRLYGKSTLRARQCSKRGGDILVELQGDSVLLTGEAVTVVEGSLTL